jgi:ankyrin repeat protein
VREKLTGDPALARERYASRTLLHDASAHANLSMVELLLRLGADPNCEGGHGPLYSLANECRVPGGGSVARTLVHAGANVNANDGVKRCTALHMAARRGNVEVAEALLDCGADIEARDSLGETPLRRSVNCNKIEVAALLLSRGADRDSRGSKGLTPLTAARTTAMKRLLQPCSPGRNN